MDSVTTDTGPVLSSLEDLSAVLASFNAILARILGLPGWISAVLRYGFCLQDGLPGWPHYCFQGETASWLQKGPKTGHGFWAPVLALLLFPGGNLGFGQKGFKSGHKRGPAGVSRGLQGPESVNGPRKH